MNRLKTSLTLLVVLVVAAFGPAAPPAQADCGMDHGSDTKHEAGTTGKTGQMPDKHMHGEHMTGMHMEQLDIVEVRVERPEIVEVNTGEKKKMSDGQMHDYYETHLDKDGTALVTVELQMVATSEDQKVTFDPRTVRLIDPHEVDRKDSTLPFARFVEKDWTAIGDEPVPVDYKATMQFAFEVPEDRLPMLVLSIGGKDVAPVADLLEKSRAEAQKES